MFRMGGPIKEGIMHGIREPYVRGKIVGSAMPHIKRGFEAFKNIFGKTAPQNVEIGQQIKRLPPTGGYSKGYPGLKTPGGWERGPMITETQNIFTPKPWAAATGKYLASSPEGRAVKWIWDGKGWVAKTAKGIAKSPTAAIGLTYMGGKWLLPDGTPASDEEIKNINAPLNPNLQAIQDKNKKKGTGTGTGTAKEFAESQRDARVNKYLDMMGYGKAQKNAAYDALIDASKIITDRGNLKGNVTGEVINPIIQSASARFNKPEQIREAVGLMATKAAIEKDLEDPTVKALRVANLEKLNREASPSISETIMGYMASKKDDVKGKELVDLVRLAADKKNTPFKFISEEEIAKITGMEGKTALEIVSQTAETDGVYMVGDSVIEIIGGIPRQIK
jgi:hypothetical protein